MTRFALLIWEVMADAGSPTPQASSDALSGYLAAMRSEGLKVELTWFAIAPTAQWTVGEPYDAVVKGLGPRPPLLDPTVLYNEAELSGFLTLEGTDEQTALLWASRYPFIASIEVRRIDEGGVPDPLESSVTMREVARGRWANPVGIAADRVQDIIWNRHELVPSLLRALAETAPTGQLHMIGVGELEDLSMAASHRGIEDPTIDLLIAADIPPDALLEILSGPWPDYLERWRAAERLRGILSDAQCAELEARYRQV